MKRWIQKRSREQVVLLGVLAGLGPPAMWGVVFADVPDEAELAAAVREPVVGTAVAVEFPNPDFAAYWNDERRLWSVEGGARIPLYELREPLSPAPRLCAPPLQPAPSLDLYYTQGGLDRFALGQSGEPPLPPERLAALLALEIPEPRSRQDRRAERLYEWDTIVFVDDTRREGEILNIDDAGAVMLESPPGSGNRMKYNKDRIKELLRRYTNLERFETAYAEMRASKDWKARSDLAVQTLAWGMMDETVKLVQEARALEPRNEELIARLTDLYVETGDFDSAVALLGDASAEGRLKRDVHGVRLGWLLADIGLTEAALGAFASVAPLSDEGRLGQAWMEWRLGRFDAARASARAVSAGRVSGVELNLLKAMIEWTQPTMPDETLDARLSLVRPPMDAAVKSVEGGAAPGARNGGLLNRLVGVVTALEGKSSAAVFFANAADLDPSSAESWTNLGWTYLTAGLPVEAAGLFGEALERDPADADAVVGQALCARAAGDAAAMESLLSQAEAIAPGHYYVPYVRALTAADPGPHFAAVLARRFDFGPVYLPAGLHAREKKRLLEAETLLRRAVVQDRTIGPALALAALLIRLEQTVEAREMLGAIRGETPEEDAALLYAQGYLEYAAGDGPAEKRLPRVKQVYFEPAAAMGSAPAKEAVELIDDWLATEVVLNEGFDGEDGADVGGPWSARLLSGAAAAIDGGGARIQGKHADTGSSQIEAEFNGEDFWRMEATIRVGEKNFSAAGVALYYAKATEGNWRGVYVALRQQGGRFMFRSGSAVSGQILGGTLTGKDHAEPAVPKEKFCVWFQTVGEARAEKLQILVRIDDEADWRVLEEGIPLGKTDKRLRAAIFGGGAPGEDFSFHADDVRVYTRKRK